MRRFFCTNINADNPCLMDDEARHALTVLRAKIGTKLTIFDGRGAERTCQVANTERHSITLNPLGPSQLIDRRSAQIITIAVAYPKARARTLLTEKLVELGVHRIIPLLTERGSGAPDKERIAREALAACKQCGINTLPEIMDPVTPQNLSTVHGPLIVLDPAGSKTPPSIQNCCLVVGPEGGFSDEESAALNGPRWNLGSSILRVETACLVAIARLNA